MIRDSFTEEELIKYPELKRRTNLFCLKYILKRITKGKNALILTYGETGSGKSWINLRMAELLMVMQGKIFDTKHRVFFKLEELAKYSDMKDLPPGDVSVSEELGVSMGARKWQKNINYSELLQTFRDIQSICFFNVPFRIMADKHARYLAHFEMSTLPREGNKNVMKFFLLQKNPRAKSEGKTVYTKYLKLDISDYWKRARKKPIKKMFWRKPSKEVLDIYLPMQKAFKSSVRKDIVKKGKEEVEANRKPGRILKVTDEQIIEMDKTNLIESEKAKALNISPRTLRRRKKDMIKKAKNDQKPIPVPIIPDGKRNKATWT